MYVPLRTHGWHALLTGVDPPSALLERAGELGLPALALTDVDTLGGSVDFLRAATRDAARVRPILGAEISDPSGRPGRVVALVESEQGYRNLCKLVSARQLGDDPGAKDVDLRLERFDLVEATERFQEGLLLLVDHPRLAFALAGRVPARRLFVAVSPAALARRPRAARGRPLDPDERVPLLPAPKVPPPARAVSAQELCECARLLKLATLAVADVHYARAEGHEAQRVRTAIKHNALRCDLSEEWLAERPAHLLSGAEMETLYAGLPDCRGPFRAPRSVKSRESGTHGMLQRTRLVAEACTWLPPLGGVVFPTVTLEGHETPYSMLCALAFDGARRRYLPLRPEVVRRLDHELAAIEGLGFAPYFLLVKRIADFARARAIPCVGRGSAADSLVAYCLELTDADPLRYRLPFERFLNPARKDRPDIDLDFCWRRRDEVLAEVGAAFGVERTAMIATLSTFGMRAALREVALAEGLPPVEVNRWSRRLPGMGAGLGAAEAGTGEVPDGSDEDESESAEEEESVTGDESGTPLLHPLPPALEHDPLARTFAATPECRGFPFEDERWAFVLRMASALLDCPRHLGLHPGGVVVTPGPITDFVACQRASKGVLMTQLDKDGVEAIGLVKMDLLGNRALTVVDDCLQSIGMSHAELAQLPEDDPRTQELLEHGRTLGCFQVESPGMRNLLQQIGARSMDDVIQAVALIRPGPAGSGMKDAYIRRFRGLEEPHAPHPRLTELLWETQGVMLYQEDVMQAVVLLAGFELAEADLLRRSLAKKRGAELAQLRERFLAACVRERIDAEGTPGDAARIWELIANFSAFGFCKAHAVTYGRIAYRTVWLKAHHPAAFLTAFLNSQTGYYDTRVYVEEARRLGVLILPPDVNRSGQEFSLEHGAHAASAAIRVGLERVKGLSEATRRSLLAERTRGGPYLSLPDFLERSGARTDETESLVLAGAFDAFDRTRPEMLLRLHLLRTSTRRAPDGLDAALLAACRTTPAVRERESGWSRPSLGLAGLNLAPGESTPLFPAPPTPALALPALPEMDPVRRGRLELELLGLTVSGHPTALFPCAPARGPRTTPTPCAELARRRDERVELVGWLVASRPVRTSGGRWMRFLTLEDESGIAEVVLFPDVYARDGHRLAGRGPFRIRGRVEDHMGACTLHAEHIG